MRLSCPACGRVYVRPPSWVRNNMAQTCSVACRSKLLFWRAAASFWDRVDKSGDCWLWIGCLGGGGYGAFKIGGARLKKQFVAHRWAYQQLRGPIPDGMTLDHLCRVRRCVNPDHLEVVTLGENVLRGEGLTAQRARQVFCLRGHLLVGDNLYRQRRRCCRVCHRIRQRHYVTNRRARVANGG